MFIFIVFYAKNAQKGGAGRCLARGAASMRKSAVSIVKHCENEKSITNTKQKHSKIDFFDFRFSFSPFFMAKTRKTAGRGGASPEGLLL